MTPTISPYEDADRQGVLDLILTIQQHEFAIPITLDEQPDLLAVESFYRIGKGDFWVAKDAGRVVGTIALKDIGENQAALRKMFVAATHRGRPHAVSARLLQTALAAAAERGIAEILLGTTAKFHAAHRFYEKNGFTEIDKSELPRNFPLVDVDTKFYRITISPSHEPVIR
ncbi:GNAT family N-acetyltransferase [Afifella marina]|uniref:Acetyltransferase (GNAT) domain-containing protein n=1 Tax=Afifella marina DSM 2698 TaxID=1120955 RepID=A0A1G5NYD5_AFIMA|nr:GNAT family N-acetyltransferase [Afifella marina]MBK1624458.1 N-acetyltransferase [Afifella marina DSM 2698]MBK1628190.1 N-acetyltransferase [Afifella marina]MBK5916624.1 GNAT family N-acetyltransferase [Afifella marina]RAI18979.1 GNAT family N-acetyltransferase [Afifella marina DSM 2698]SCZ41869.1 Acetyltransferase (GNAT) domain-containing protein [Afifella marina DSM 2698]